MKSVEWNTDIMDFADELKDEVKRACEESALQFYAKVIEYTPVRTGDLRASWQISVSTPSFSYATGGSEIAPQQAPTVPQSIPGLPDFPIIYVTNGAPYVGYVNDGSPTNAPVHMVERALDAIR